MEKFTNWMEAKEKGCTCKCAPCVESNNCKDCDCKDCKCEGCGCGK